LNRTLDLKTNGSHPAAVNDLSQINVNDYLLNADDSDSPLADESDCVTQKTSQYSRKEKSLGELCRRFLNAYGVEGKAVLLLDSCTKELGVERRRIYDIINILESFCVIRRRAKNEYQWRGIDKIACSIEAQILQGTMLKSNKAGEPRDLSFADSFQNSNLLQASEHLNEEADLNLKRLPKHKLVEVPSDEEDRLMC
jgi:hypothetical protein